MACNDTITVSLDDLPLSSVTLCLDPVCMARRAAKWAQECGEEPEYVTCPVCHGHGLMQGDGSGWDGTAYHDPGCDFCQGGGAVPKHVALEYKRTKRAATREERP